MDSPTLSTESEESEDSIIEIEGPKKPSPQVIDLSDDEVVINVGEVPDTPQDPNVPSTSQSGNEAGISEANIRIKQERVEEEENDDRNQGAEEHDDGNNGQNNEIISQLRTQIKREGMNRRGRNNYRGRGRGRRNNYSTWVSLGGRNDLAALVQLGSSNSNAQNLFDEDYYNYLSNEPWFAHAPYPSSPFARFFVPFLPLRKVKTEKEEDMKSYHPDHWTPEMVKFYDEPWGNEKDFDLEKLQAQMDKHPMLWEMSEKDIAFWKEKDKESAVRCHNCFAYGHESYECTDEQRTPNCHMCGQPGHIAYKCPQAICLNCGTRTTSYVTKCKNCKFGLDRTCERCHLSGHIYPECPDHWRLYHSTTGTCRVQEPTVEVHKPMAFRWCCNCGQRGHLQVDCGHYVKNSDFSDTCPLVKSYVKAFAGSNQKLYHYMDPARGKRVRVNPQDNVIADPAQKHDFHGMTSQLRNRMKLISKEYLVLGGRKTFARQHLQKYIYFRHGAS